MTLVMLMRHGEAENNVQHILAGRKLEFHLTERGRAQVSSTAESLKAIPIDAIYTSPMTRTVETAKIVSEKAGVDYSRDGRLIETDMGGLTGMTYSQVVEKYGNLFRKFYEGDDDDDGVLNSMHVESFSAIRSRVKDMLEYVAMKHPEESVLLVTHLDPVKAALMQTINLGPEALYKMSIKNASLAVLKHGSIDYSLLAFNVMDISRYPSE